jgi:hypothetical protein
LPIDRNCRHNVVIAKFGMLTLADGEKCVPSDTPPSAQIEEPPSPAKLELIRQFLQLIGLQERLNTGSFLERHAVPGGPMWKVMLGKPIEEDLLEGFQVRFDALKTAYSKHRETYQQEYEDHLNWEFTESELKEIVGFLDTPVGQHYLDGRWRMEAYTNTNTEDLEEEILKEALASLQD